MRPRLETRRLLLRPVENADALPTARLMDAHVARYLLSWSAEVTVEECRVRIRAAREALRRSEDVAFAIVNRAGNRLMGWIGLARDPVDPARARLGYWIGAADEGQGYMNEAVEAFLPAATALLGTRIVEASVHPDNAASIAILRRQGFTLDRSASVRFPASGMEEKVMVYRKDVA